MSNILDFWSHDSSAPREQQAEVLKWIQETVETTDARYIVCECPVGTGKSHIGVTAARWINGGDKAGGCYIVTPQRILQEQYERSFAHRDKRFMTSLYGKSNYTCERRHTTCDVGSLLKPRCPNCPNAEARANFRVSSCGVTNYSLLLSKMQLPARKTLVLDECHNIEEILCEHDSWELTEYRCKQLEVPWKVTTASSEEVVCWIAGEVMDAAIAKAEDLAAKCEEILRSPTPSNAQAKTIQTAQKFFTFVERLELLVEEMTNSESFFSDWVFIRDAKSYKFKRLYARHAFAHAIEPLAEDRIIFLSSTVLDINVFCKSLGLRRDEVAFISTDSSFPAERRPVFYRPVMKMNAQWASAENEDNRTKMINEIVKICEKHRDASGIIHTGNYKISQWLVKSLAGRINQRIVHHNPGGENDEVLDRNNIISDFTAGGSVPSLLISPSITEGLDLSGDLARFAIFAKIPFGNLGDDWIKRRMEISSRWYQLQALIEIIQGGGRVVRSEEDWGEVYILDSAWAYLYDNTKSSIPAWWKKAYHAKE